MKRFYQAIAKAAGIAAIAVLCSPPARPQEPAADIGKMVIERPIRKLASGAARGSESGSKVEPGLVKWHVDFAAARAAALRSGKPVLLFQMMGRLDDRFC